MQKCSTPCHEFNWKGDKTCDDKNNHCGCGWDGGDCCGTTKDYDFLYCKECKCLDPAHKDKDMACKASFIGDNYCDAVNNHANCEYDGGDCCHSVKAKAGKGRYNFCSGKEILPGGACTCKVIRISYECRLCMVVDHIIGRTEKQVLILRILTPP